MQLAFLGKQTQGGGSPIDPLIVGHCRRARDQVWAKAVPTHEYTAS
jgi:hypothetical protein